jgi:hypothetical protein
VFAQYSIGTSVDLVRYLQHLAGPGLKNHYDAVDTEHLITTLNSKYFTQGVQQDSMVHASGSDACKPKWFNPAVQTAETAVNNMQGDYLIVTLVLLARHLKRRHSWRTATVTQRATLPEPDTLKAVVQGTVLLLS